MFEFPTHRITRKSSDWGTFKSSFQEVMTYPCHSLLPWHDYGRGLFLLQKAKSTAHNTFSPWPTNVIQIGLGRQTVMIFFAVPSHLCNELRHKFQRKPRILENRAGAKKK